MSKWGNKRYNGWGVQQTTRVFSIWPMRARMSAIRHFSYPGLMIILPNAAPVLLSWTFFAGQLRDRLQISLLTLSEFKRITELLFPLKSSEIHRLNSLNNTCAIWRRSITLKVLSNVFTETVLQKPCNNCTNRLSVKKNIFHIALVSSSKTLQFIVNFPY